MTIDVDMQSCGALGRPGRILLISCAHCGAGICLCWLHERRQQMSKRVLPYPDRILSQVTSMHAVGWRESRGFEAVQLDEVPIIGTLWLRCHEQNTDMLDPGVFKNDASFAVLS